MCSYKAAQGPGHTITVVTSTGTTSKHTVPFVMTLGTISKHTITTVLVILCGCLT